MIDGPRLHSILDDLGDTLFGIAQSQEAMVEVERERNEIFRDAADSLNRISYALQKPRKLARISES